MAQNNSYEKLNTTSFTEEELENISGLCEILQSIRSRLLREGLSVEELEKLLDSKMREC